MMEQNTVHAKQTFSLFSFLCCHLVDIYRNSRVVALKPNSFCSFIRNILFLLLYVHYYSSQLVWLNILICALPNSTPCFLSCVMVKCPAKQVGSWPLLWGNFLICLYENNTVSIFGSQFFVWSCAIFIKSKWWNLMYVFPKNKRLPANANLFILSVWY